MADNNSRVRIVAEIDGKSHQIETKPMPRADADKIAAEAALKGIPAAVHPA